MNDDRQEWAESMLRTLDTLSQHYEQDALKVKDEWSRGENQGRAAAYRLCAKWIRKEFGLEEEEV